MGLFKKLWQKQAPSDQQPAACTHAALVAHWDNVADIGNEDLATRWKCSSCEEVFTPQQRRELEAAEANRIRQHRDEKAHLAQQEDDDTATKDR